MKSCHHYIKCITTTLLAALMGKRLLNSATLATATHKGVIRVSDRIGAQVGAQMINKCKVQIRMRDLYNVVESFKEGDEKMYYLCPGNRIFCWISILVFLFLQ